MALRQTCRAVREQADALLFAHVAFAALAHPHMEYRSGQDLSLRLPLYRQTNLATLVLWQRQLSRTRFIDIYTSEMEASSPCISPKPNERCQWEPEVFPPEGLEIVRRAHRTIRPPSAHALIDYVDLMESDPRPIWVDSIFRHYILHLAFVQCRTRPRQVSLRHGNGIAWISSVTIVLAPESDLSVHRRWWRPCDLLSELMEGVKQWLARGAHLTIVGAERCHPTYLGLSKTAWREVRSARVQTEGLNEELSASADEADSHIDWAIRSRLGDILLGHAPPFEDTSNPMAMEDWETWWHPLRMAWATMEVVGYDEWCAFEGEHIAGWRPAKIKDEHEAQL